MISEEIQQLSSAVFGRMRAGRHYSAADGDLFYQIEENQDELRDIFRAVGFDLILDPNSFAYLDGDTDSLITKQIVQKEAAFFFVLIQWLIEEGESPHQMIREAKPISVDNLPHITRASFSDVMKSAGVIDDEDLTSILRGLARRGFIDNQPSSFKMRSPCFRFIQLCLGFVHREDGEEE